MTREFMEVLVVENDQGIHEGAGSGK